MNGLNPKLLKTMRILTENGFIGKGGLIVYLNIKDKTKMLRYSSDIDVTYKKIDSDQNILKVIQKLFPNSLCQISRESGEKRTLQIMIDDISVDIESSGPHYFKIIQYETPDGIIEGCSIYDVLADKLRVLSLKTIFRRIKDLVDVYNLISIYEIDKNNLEQAISKRNPLENFSPLFNQKENIQHAYETLSLFNEEGEKEDFNKVYDTVKKFIEGYFLKDNKIWSPGILEWCKNNIFITKDTNYKIMSLYKLQNGEISSQERGEDIEFWEKMKRKLDSNYKEDEDTRYVTENINNISYIAAYNIKSIQNALRLLKS